MNRLVCLVTKSFINFQWMKRPFFCERNTLSFKNSISTMNGRRKKEQFENSNKKIPFIELKKCENLSSIFKKDRKKMKYEN